MVTFVGHGIMLSMAQAECCWVGG